MDEKQRLEALGVALDTLIKHAPVGIGLLDRELRHVRVNAALAEMNGLPVDQALGRTSSELHGELGHRAEAMFREVLQTGTPVLGHEVVWAIARSEDVRHFHLSCFPASDELGTVGLYIVVVDATEQHRLVNALASSESRYRRLADDLQTSLQPPLLPRLAGAEMASVYRPAATELTVGGDFYDVLRTGEQSWFIAVGDVQGKGPLAASTTAAVRWAFRTSASGTSDPMRIVDTINAVLLEHDAEEGLCTLGLVHARRSGTVIQATCVSAGHPLPRLVRSEAPRVVQVGRPGTLLGVIPQIEAQAEHVVLGEGDMLVLVTDGVTEARYQLPGGGVELFGDDRLDALLRACVGWSATMTAARIETGIMDFQAGRAADDIAAVVLRNTGRAAAGTTTPGPR